MGDSYQQTLKMVVERVGDFPEEAFHFVREGLGVAVDCVHGPESPAQKKVMHFLHENKIDLLELSDLHDQGELDDAMVSAIEQAGGIEKINRHVRGADLCWGLRDYAQQRWGKMARTVLGQWNVQSTHDFGRIVFAMIDFDLMQKQPSDSIADFKDVFDFDQGFEAGYEIIPDRA